MEDLISSVATTTEGDPDDISEEIPDKYHWE
jgi:hypothetical protein